LFSSRGRKYAGKQGHALHFSGADNRRATTLPLDVRFGGHVDFKLMMAPDDSYDSCKQAFLGTVELHFMVDPSATILSEARPE